MDDHDKAMLSVFIDKPEKEAWYEQAFSQYSINGVDQMRWVWSWWAFGGGPFFLLYRKAYFAAGILFAVMILISVVPFGTLATSILAGGYANYFVYKVYREKRREIETKVSEEQLQIETMKQVGGYHTWVIWVAALLFALWLAGVVAFVKMSGVAG